MRMRGCFLCTKTVQQSDEGNARRARLKNKSDGKKTTDSWKNLSRFHLLSSLLIPRSTTHSRSLLLFSSVREHAGTHPSACAAFIDNLPRSSSELHSRGKREKETDKDVTCCALLLIAISMLTFYVYFICFLPRKDKRKLSATPAVVIDFSCLRTKDSIENGCLSKQPMMS